jgi:hypothetical protein
MLEDSKIKILVCCHKPSELPQDGIFLPIHVGAAISVANLGIQRDDQLNGEPCDNISNKNRSFCELTAIYWAWKNIKSIYPNLEYIGLNHYRRFFAFNETRLTSSGIPKDVKGISEYKLDTSRIESWLSANKVITTPRAYLKTSVASGYEHAHYSSDLRVIHDIVRNDYPEFLNAFNDVFLGSNYFYDCNMFIMPWNEFDDYCKWLFGILFKAEKIIDIEKYDNYQKRIYGFLAERLWTVWVKYKQYSLKNLNYYVYTENPKKIDEGLVARLKYKKMRIKDNFAFFLSKVRGNKQERYWTVP